MVLSTAYFPPVEFFSILAENSAVQIEAYEHYQKQSWRNRCRILTASGPMDLRVPVIHGPDLYHTPVKDVLVDYSTPWVTRSEYAIETAYSSSPFFEYYRDPLFAILDSSPRNLWDLDLEIIRFFCARLGLSVRLCPTSAYCGVDMFLHPKISSSYVCRPYWQVFGNGPDSFVPGLSVMDLLFNEGPESICYL